MLFRSHVVAWFSGRTHADEEGSVASVGWALLRDAICEAAGCTPEAFKGAYVLHGDTAETAADLLRDQGGSSAGPAMGAFIEILRGLARPQATGSRRDSIAGFLRRCDANDARHAVKVLTGNLRIGLKEGLVEDAVAHAFDAGPDAVRKASMVLGNLSHVALLASEQRLHEAVLRPMRPVRVMLANPEPGPAAVYQRILSWSQGAASGAWAEDKHDGIRCQIHCHGGKARLFSRDLKDITATFPEIAESLRTSGREFVLDGEIGRAHV